MATPYGENICGLFSIHGEFIDYPAYECRENYGFSKKNEGGAS